MLGKQYREQATDENARLIAHRFADEIILRLGGGIPGIAETKMYFVSTRGGTKEIWQMDYDGANQKQLTHLGSIALSPHVSPDNSRVAFSGVTKEGWQILMYSLELEPSGELPAFSPATTIRPRGPRTDRTSPSHRRAPATPRSIRVSSSGGNLRRLTENKGPDVSPAWNPKTNAQIAWVSGRTGLPQIYTMASDGTNAARVTDQGYAVSPSWSPNGQFLAFAWVRHYGPGTAGRQRHLCDGHRQQAMGAVDARWRHEMIFPRGRRTGDISYFSRIEQVSCRFGRMLADGSEQRQLTKSGESSQPNWSFK